MEHPEWTQVLAYEEAIGYAIGPDVRDKDGLSAALAVASTTGRAGPMAGWSVVAGLLLGTCVMLSYGLPLLGPLALAVLFLARAWRPPSPCSAPSASSARPSR